MVSNQKFPNLAHLNQHLGQRFPVEILSRNSELLNQCFSDAFFRIVEVSKFVKFFPFAEASSWKTSCTSAELEGGVSSNLVVGDMVCQFYETENLERIFRVYLENQPGYAFFAIEVNWQSLFFRLSAFSHRRYQDALIQTDFSKWSEYRKKSWLKSKPVCQHQLYWELKLEQCFIYLLVGH